MVRYVSALIALMVFIAPANAQNSDAEQALVNAFKAEHQAWRSDVNRWENEHEAALRILEEALARFEEETALARHSERIREHGTALDGTGLGELAGHHAHTRSQHEEMREAHHHLMDAIAKVAKAVDENLGAIGDKAPQTNKTEND
ncbi:hypothetical protein [Hyphococcus sp.]|uniref:hypothetical protein n=1 Tax=Hyphococcus sp. TaxID=2038636 RepID=UPI003CCBEEE2